MKDKHKGVGRVVKYITLQSSVSASVTEAYVFIYMLAEEGTSRSTSEGNPHPIPLDGVERVSM